MPFEDGPYIQTACFCEMVLHEKTEVLSLIRVIDTITHGERGPEPPETMPPFPYSLQLVLMMKSGNARGRYDLRITPEKPDGSTDNSQIFTVYFEGEERGSNLILNFNLMFEMEGLYWFNVYIGDEKLTALPLRVKYQRNVISTTPAVG
jgi:hypothetical protein